MNESPTTSVRKAAKDAPADLVDAHTLGRVVNLDAVKRSHDPQLVDAVVENMIRGDDLGYEAWLSLRPLKTRGKQVVEDALRNGIASTPDATPELTALFDQVDTVPDWVNWEQLDRGCVAYWRTGTLVPIVLGYSSVGFGYYSYGGTKALNFTRLLIEPDRAGGRMTETLRWITTVTTPGNLRRYSPGFAYAMRVRLVHSAVRFGVSRSPKWQWHNWGLPITNTDLFFTSSNVFCANVVQALERLGTRFTAQEREDIFALWRYIGYLMGVPDELNLVDAADSLEKNAVVLAVEKAPDAANQMLLHSLLQYTATATDGYQPFPAWIINRLTERHKLVIAYGLLRNLTSKQFCDDMAVPDTRFKYVVKAAAHILRVKEAISRRLPHDDAKASAAILAEFAEAVKVDESIAIASTEEVQSAIRHHESGLDRTLLEPFAARRR